MRESWLPAAPQSAGTARAIVRDAATEWGCDRTSTWDLVLATSEAVANAVVHGKACANRGGIRLSVRDCDRGVCVEVWDCGSFDRIPEPMSANGTSGRGLGIIAAVTDHFELVPNRSGTLVRFAKSRAPAAAA
jgi:serine/threonine-protein kinase RsbW